MNNFLESFYAVHWAIQRFYRECFASIHSFIHSLSASHSHESSSHVLPSCCKRKTFCDMEREKRINLSCEHLKFEYNKISPFCTSTSPPPRWAPHPLPGSEYLFPRPTSAIKTFGSSKHKRFLLKEFMISEPDIHTTSRKTKISSDGDIIVVLCVQGPQGI